MSDLAATALPPLDLAHLAAIGTTIGRAARGACQLAGLGAAGLAFAATIWLALAGPGFLADPSHAGSGLTRGAGRVVAAR